MEHGTRGREQRRPGLRLHDIAANCKDMLARTVGQAAQAQVFSHRIERVLHVLRIGRGTLIDDHQIGGDATRAQIFLRLQGFARDSQINIVIDADGKDREIAGDRQRPKCRLRRETGLHGGSIRTQLHVGIDQVAAKHLEACGFLRGDADMTHLYLRTGPGVDKLMVKAVGVTIAIDSLVDILAVWRSDGPEDHADLLACRYPHDTAQRNDRIERIAIRAGKLRIRIESLRFGKRASCTDEPAPVRFRLGVAGAGGIVDNQMRNLHIRLARAALVARDADDVTLRIDFRLQEHLGKQRMGAVGIIRGQDWLGIGRHLDEAVLGTGIEQDHPAAFGIVLGGDDTFDFTGEIADRLDELGLVVAEAGSGLFTFGAARFRRCRPPVSGGRVAQEDERAGTVLGRIGFPAGNGLAVPAGIARTGRRQHHGVMTV